MFLFSFAPTNNNVTVSGHCIYSSFLFDFGLFLTLNFGSVLLFCWFRLYFSRWPCCWKASRKWGCVAWQTTSDGRSDCSVQNSLWLVSSVKLAFRTILSSLTWAPLDAILNIKAPRHCSAWWGHVGSIQCLVQWHFRKVFISSNLSPGEQSSSPLPPTVIAVRGRGQVDIETTQGLLVIHWLVQ